jgi:transcriptional regulator with XRE-family HTH domain
MKTKKTKEIHLVVEKLINIRNYKRLNQAEFAELIDIDYTIYNKIESGQLKLSLEKLSKIARNLNVREIDIFTYPKVFREFDSNNEEIEAQLTIKLKENLKEQVLEMVFGNKNIEILNK